MASKRGDAKVEVERIAQLFASIVDKKIQFSFAKFSFPITIKEIKLARIGDMENKPEKRTDDEGNMYTPPVMQMNTSDGILYFIVEDIEVAAITNGMQIICGANNIAFREG